MTPKFLSISALLTLAAALPAVPQGPAPGVRMFAPHGTSDSFLVDTNNQILHTWTGGGNPGNGAYLNPDGTLIRMINVASVPGTTTPQVGGRGGRIQKLAYDSTVLWDYEMANANQWTHHDCALLPNGNVLVIAWDRVSLSQAFAAGRDPALMDPGATEFLPDGIVELQQTGPTTAAIVWEWHMMDHVIQDFDSTKANFGVVADHPELLDINFPGTPTSDNGEWNHCNAVAYDAVNDLVILSSPYQEEFWFIDHSTTTAEAAGSTGGNYGVGGDFVYRWGNPQAYRAGTAADQKLFFQHGTHVIPPGLRGAGNVLIFNNRAGQAVGQDYSTVVELTPPTSYARPAPGSPWGPSGFVWEYKEPTPTNLFSSGLSNAERLPNGNTLVCSGRQAWLFELDQADNRVWEIFPSVPSIIFQVSYYDRGLWADQETLVASAGGTVDWDIAAGSARGRHTYVMLGSTSGTAPGFTVNGVNIPLNIDGYTISLLTSVGTGPFTDWVGVLDAQGNATASFPLPPLPVLAGINMNHAYFTVHPALGTVSYASNAVPLTFQ